MIPKKEFMQELYITCKGCGYNNLKKRNENFGTCLRCGEILDYRSYFKAQMRKLAMKTPRARDKKRYSTILYF